ncbi:MAG: M64 family metallo-endopeptidase, partial [Methanoregula sp.]|nr:M64 family metallo-endopeptidase [Methanoregula sp.]
MNTFILVCVIALMVPVSADPYSPDTQTDRISLTLLNNSVPDSLINPGTIILGGQYAGIKIPYVLVVPVKKEQNTLWISNSPFDHKIGNIQIRKGTLPYIQKTTELSTVTPYDVPTIEILDQNDTVLYSEKFSYQNLMTVPMKIPGQADDQVPPVISTTTETTVVLPYIDGGRKIRVVDENGQNGDIVALEVSQIPYQVSGILDQLTAPPPANPGSFNILILASGYSSLTISSFNTKANLLKQQILNTEPFTSYGTALSVNIYPDTLDLGCYPGCSGIDRLMCCDSSKVMSAAEDSGSLYDEIIVIDNTATYSGGGMRDGGTAAYKTNSYSSYCQVYNGQYTVPMALHEFGHSFGDLCDEYSYGSEGYTYSSCVNCRASCSDWSAYSDICTLGCDARSEFFRPDRSIMLDYSSPVYNQVSIKADYLPDGLEKRLSFFIGVSPTAGFTGTPTTGTAPLDVSFTDSSTGASITNRRWDFGDGNISNYVVSTNPVHRYASAGTYSVNLTVTNAGGSNSLLRSNYVTVAAPPVAPVAAFTGTPTTGTAPLDVSFTDSS